MRTLVRLRERQTGGLTEGRGGFLGHFYGCTHVGHDPWCSKSPRRAPAVTISDGQPLVQGQFGARYRHELACTHFTPGQCVQHWVIVRVTGPVFAEGPLFLGAHFRWCCKQRSAIVRVNN